jgi:glycosyltransferase involved in cell wall biosynthesis
VTILPSPYGYPSDEVLGTSGSSIPIREWRRVQLLFKALREFDVVHYNYGSTIFPWRRSELGGLLRRTAVGLYTQLTAMRDLDLLASLSKPLFVTFQGDDVRQGDYCRAHFAQHWVHEVNAAYYPPGSDDRKRWAVTRFRNRVAKIYALNPDLLHVLPAGSEFLPYAHVDPREWRPRAPVDSGASIRIVHAPSHREVKGTRYVIDAVSQLKAKGFALDLVLVEGLPRDEARKVYESADLVVDQLLAGWYGGLAVEAMALGKPVVSYIREGDLKFVPEIMRAELPILRATAGTIADVLRALVGLRKEGLRNAGMRSREYVERWHDPRVIAGRVSMDYSAARAAVGVA